MIFSRNHAWRHSGEMIYNCHCIIRFISSKRNAAWKASQRRGDAKVMLKKRKSQQKETQNGFKWYAAVLMKSLELNYRYTMWGERVRIELLHLMVFQFKGLKLTELLLPLLPSLYKHVRQLTFVSTLDVVQQTPGAPLIPSAFTESHLPPSPCPRPTYRSVCHLEGCLNPTRSSDPQVHPARKYLRPSVKETSKRNQNMQETNKQKKIYSILTLDLVIQKTVGCDPLHSALSCSKLTKEGRCN